MVAGAFFRIELVRILALAAARLGGGPGRDETIPGFQVVRQCRLGSERLGVESGRGGEVLLMQRAVPGQDQAFASIPGLLLSLEQGGQPGFEFRQALGDADPSCRTLRPVWAARTQFVRGAKFFHCLGELPLENEQLAKVVMKVGAIFLELDSVAERGAGFVEPPFRVQDAAEIVVGLGVVLHQFEGLLAFGDRFVQLTLGPQSGSQEVMNIGAGGAVSIGILLVETESLPQLNNCLVQLALAKKCSAEVVVSLCEVLIDLKSFSALGDGLIELTDIRECAAEVAVGHGVVVVDAEGLSIFNDGLIELAFFLQSITKVDMRSRTLRLQGCSNTKIANRLLHARRLRQEEKLSQDLVDPEVRDVPVLCGF